MTDETNSLTLAQERTELAKQRNSLASERTFLAWLRTGLGGVGGGVAVIRLLSFQDPTHKQIAHWIGYFFILWGVAIFLLALIDYNKRRSRLNLQADYAGSRTFICLLTASLVVVSLVLFYIIFHR